MRTEPVVLVHGWGGSFRSTWQAPGWEALLNDAGRRVIGVDLLGHGTAPKSHDPSDYRDLTPRVRDAIGNSAPVDAVGFSLGAMTLLALAAREPSLFGRIVVGGIGENVFRRDDEAHARLVAAVRGEGDTSDVTSQVFAQYASQPGNDPEALAACLSAPRARLSPEVLGAVTCPVLVALGDKDFAGPADPLVAALPSASLVVLRNVDHFATPESFAFIDAALEYLDAVPA
ncbi:MAG TPA: alpha/beta fold hydrolase [Acidimicrobiales bacterium]